MECKICPACLHENKPSEFICKSCLTPLESVEIVQCDEKRTSKEEKLQLEIDNNILHIYTNSVVGREEKGSEILKKYPTISRKHAQFICEDGKWFVKDLSSTNGIYLNGKKQLAEVKIPIRNADILGLSQNALFKVVL